MPNAIGELTFDESYVVGLERELAGYEQKRAGELDDTRQAQLDSRISQVTAELKRAKSDGVTPSEDDDAPRRGGRRGRSAAE